MGFGVSCSFFMGAGRALGCAFGQLKQQHSMIAGKACSLLRTASAHKFRPVTAVASRPCLLQHAQLSASLVPSSYTSHMSNQPDSSSIGMRCGVCIRCAPSLRQGMALAGQGGAPTTHCCSAHKVGWSGKAVRLLVNEQSLCQVLQFSHAPPSTSSCTHKCR